VKKKMERRRHRQKLNLLQTDNNGKILRDDTGSPIFKPTVVVASNKVTDHAILRYIERCYGLDVEKIKREILEYPGLMQALEAGVTSYRVNGINFKCANGKIITTIK